MRLRHPRVKPYRGLLCKISKENCPRAHPLPMVPTGDRHRWSNKTKYFLSAEHLIMFQYFHSHDLTWLLQEHWAGERWNGYPPTLPVMLQDLLAMTWGWALRQSEWWWVSPSDWDAFLNCKSGLRKGKESRIHYKIHPVTIPKSNRNTELIPNVFFKWPNEMDCKNSVFKTLKAICPLG